MENLGLLGGILPMLLGKGDTFEGTGINPAIFGLGGMALGGKKQNNMQLPSMLSGGVPAIGLLTQLLNR